jgi:hypothetical protein
MSAAALNQVHKRIQDASYLNPILIEAGWKTHSTQAIFLKNSSGENYLFYCNRGKDCHDKPGVVVLKIENPENITPDFLEQLINSKEVDKSTYLNLEKIKTQLNAHEISYIPMKRQKVGNCVYSSLNAALYALFLIGKKDGYTRLISTDKEQKALQAYKTFRQFEAEKTLTSFLVDLETPSIQHASSEEYIRYLSGLSTVVSLLKTWLTEKRSQLRKYKKVQDHLIERALDHIAIFKKNIALFTLFRSLHIQAAQ